jgi:ABC-type antimicrobial peptide transport system permease subunit
VLRQGFSLAAAGVVLGLLLASWGSRFLEALLFEVERRDFGVLAAVALTLLAVALLAAWIPAARATRVAPAVALREE